MVQLREMYHLLWNLGGSGHTLRNLGGISSKEQMNVPSYLQPHTVALALENFDRRAT